MEHLETEEPIWDHELRLLILERLLDDSDSALQARVDLLPHIHLREHLADAVIGTVSSGSLQEGVLEESPLSHITFQRSILSPIALPLDKRRPDLLGVDLEIVRVQ